MPSSSPIDGAAGDASQDELRLLRARLAALSRTEERLRIRDGAIAAASCGIVITDCAQPDNPIIDVNPAFEKITGYRHDEVIGRNCRFLQVSSQHPEATERARRENAEALRLLREAMSARRECAVTMVNFRKGGEPFWVDLVIAPVKDARGATTHFIGIQTNVTERRLAEQRHAELLEDARAARALAEEAVRVREDFVSIASHELRTPLTTVKGYVQLLLREVQRSEPSLDRIRRVTHEVAQQVTRFEELVNDLLDVSRIQHGRLVLRREQLDLVRLVRRTFQRFERFPEGPAQASRHRLRLEAPAPVVGFFDAERIDQLVSNLLSNAIKYSPAGGEVVVAVGVEADQAVLRVSDQGIGIAPEVIPKLFQPFVRGVGDGGADGQGHNITGTGLGLYISERIVARHGGAIAVESQPGAGTTFTVRLPLAPPEARPDAEVE